MEFDLNTALNRLNVLQDYVSNCTKTSREVNPEFRAIAREVYNHGYTLHHRKVRNVNKVIWTATNNTTAPTTRKSRRENTCAEYINFAPPCRFKNQCTTRALFYCLNQDIPYDTIRKEQEANARRYYTRWNNRIAWQPVLTNRGFVRIDLSHKVRRDKVAHALKDCGKILTHSSGHCAAIEGGKVYDSWDSRLGKVDFILIKKDMVPALGESLIPIKTQHSVW